MPSHVAQKTIKELNQAEILSKNARVVFLGADFKSDPNDTRNSPYYGLKSELEDYDATVETYDPHLPELSNIDTPYVSADPVVLVTAHEDFQSLSFEELASSGVQCLSTAKTCFRLSRYLIQY